MYLIYLNMPELAYINKILNMPRVLNMPKFLIWKGPKYATMCLDKVLNISWVLNMPGFWIWQSSGCARVKQGSKYATIWLNISEQDAITPEYAWIYNNRQGSEYVSYDT